VLDPELDRHAAAELAVIQAQSAQGRLLVADGDVPGLSCPTKTKSERTFSRNFRTDVFRVPAKGAIGASATTLVRGPGINNCDLAIFKDLPVREPMRFQFRWEMYNAFNHTQFSGLDTSARFDPQGNQVNARFGEFTSARAPRVTQFAPRYHF